MKKALFSIFVLVNSLALINAHEDSHDENEYYTGFHDLLPFEYFQNGDIVTGIFVTIFWAAIIYGIVVLYMMVLAPLVRIKK